MVWWWWELVEEVLTPCLTNLELEEGLCGGGLVTLEGYIDNRDSYRVFCSGGLS